MVGIRRRDMKITIEEELHDVIKYLAKKRYDSNRKSGVKDMKVGNQSTELTDLEGLAGEFAFCKAFNLFPDLSILPRSGSHDCITHKGKTVDIKTTRYPNGKLVERVTNKLKADIYVLMVGEFPTYECIGWVESGEFLKEENITDLGHGKTYAMTQNKLNRF